MAYGAASLATGRTHGGLPNLRQLQQNGYAGDWPESNVPVSGLLRLLTRTAPRTEGVRGHLVIDLLAELGCQPSPAEAGRVVRVPAVLVLALPLGLFLLDPRAQGSVPPRRSVASARSTERSSTGED